jgi:3-deoxy-D-manno-octulosonic-acid transferase
VTSPKRPGLALGGYLAATRAIPLFAPGHLQKRLAKGKELPDRWREKLGEPTATRPDGPLIWLHAVGLGETLALRGLIAAMADRTDAQFLVTSTTRASAEVFGANLPPRTRHQFLPLDAPQYLASFLDHWKPALSVWAEQDLWPGAVAATDARGIPLALVNARMNADAYARRRRWRALYADLFARFALVTAQDDATARHLSALGAKGVRVAPSLKAAAPALAADAAALATVRASLVGRKPVLLASSHPEDEAVLLTALRTTYPLPTVLIAPRDPHRGPEIAARAAEHGLTATLRSKGQGPTADLWIVDTFGEMGLWYRLCPITVIGGTYGPTEGHNPWEPAALGSAILHRAGAAVPVQPEALPAAFAADHAAVADRARALSEAARGALDPLAKDLLTLAGLA